MSIFTGWHSIGGIKNQKVTFIMTISNFGIVIFAAIAHFLPIKYLYPSRTRQWMPLNIAASVALIGSNLALLICIGNGSYPQWLRWISLLSLGYFIFASIFFTFFDKTTAAKK